MAAKKRSAASAEDIAAKKAKIAVVEDNSVVEEETTADDVEMPVGAEDESTQQEGKNKTKKSTDQEDESKADKAAAKKGGAMYAINCKYNELQSSKGKRHTKALIDQMLKLVKQSAMTPLQFGNSPDGSRAMQASLKHGTKGQRDTILDHFVKEIPNLILHPSGGMLVEKILRYCPKVDNDEDEEGNADGKKSASFEQKSSLANKKQLSQTEKIAQEKQVEKILAPLLALGENKLSKIFFQKFGCKCFNALYSSAYMKQRVKNRLLNLIQVPKKISLLFPKFDPHAAIRTGLLQNEEFKKQPELLTESLLPHLRSIVEKCIDKELLDLPITHSFLSLHAQLAAEQMEKAEKASGEDENKEEQGSTELRTFVDQRLVVDACPHLVQTRQGVEALTHYLGYFSTKQKKALLKLFKGRYGEMASNNVCYLLVARLLATIDDTVLSQKQILAEILLDEGKVEAMPSAAQAAAKKKSPAAIAEHVGTEVLPNLCARKVLFSLFVEDDFLETKANKTAPTTSESATTSSSSSSATAANNSKSHHGFSPYEMDACFRLAAPTALKDPARRRAELRKFAYPHVLAGLDHVGWLSAASQHFLEKFVIFAATTEDAGCTAARSTSQIVKDNLLKELKTEAEKDQLVENHFDAKAGTVLNKTCIVLIRNSKEFREGLWKDVLETNMTSLVPIFVWSLLTRIG